MISEEAAQLMGSAFGISSGLDQGIFGLSDYSVNRVLSDKNRKYLEKAKEALVTLDEAITIGSDEKRKAHVTIKDLDKIVVYGKIAAASKESNVPLLTDADKRKEYSDRIERILAGTEEFHYDTVFEMIKNLSAASDVVNLLGIYSSPGCF
ncbi:MAG: hypothetical protein PHU12_03555 [Candidatus Aenigmarchaeota archaeon]|nr:hypothetical protein [Candidatus Aenigmarchaeota archaeon]